MGCRQHLIGAPSGLALAVRSERTLRRDGQWQCFQQPGGAPVVCSVTQRIAAAMTAPRLGGQHRHHVWMEVYEVINLESHRARYVEPSADGSQSTMAIAPSVKGLRIGPCTHDVEPAWSTGLEVLMLRVRPLLLDDTP